MTKGRPDRCHARERLAEQIVACLAEADRLGLTMAAIDLDAALHKVRAAESLGNH